MTGFVRVVSSLCDLVSLKCFPFSLIRLRLTATARSCRLFSRLLATWMKWQLMWWPQRRQARSTWRKKVRPVWSVHLTNVDIFNNSVSYKHISGADTMDFSGMSLIKLRKEEMESQVSYGMSLWSQLTNRLMSMLFWNDTVLFPAFTWINFLPALLSVDTHLFNPYPSGESAGIRKSVGKRATAFGWAEEEALRPGWSSSKRGFWGKWRNLFAGQSFLFVTKTHQTCSHEETCAGSETQHPSQNYSKKAVKKKGCVLYIIYPEFPFGD